MCFLQLQILTDWQDKKGDKRFLKVKDADLVTSRHSKPKKQKLDGKGSHAPGPGPGRPKTKNLQPKVQEFDFSEDPQEIPRNPKNDAPNRYNSACTEDAVIFKVLCFCQFLLGVLVVCCRFWASVEPYCADITNEEIRVLEELLKPPEDEAEYYKVC